MKLDPKRLQLMTKYYQLEDFEKRILQLCSIIYEPMSITNITKCVKRCNILSKQNTPITNPKLTQYFDKFSSLGLATKNYKKHAYVRSEIIELLTTEASKNDYFLDYLNVVQDVIHINTYSWSRHPDNIIRCIRDVRIGLYTKNTDMFYKSLDTAYNSFPELYKKSDYTSKLFDNPFRLEWFKELPLPIQAKFLPDVFISKFINLHSIEPQVSLLTNYQNFTQEQGGHEFRNSMANLLIFKGQLDEAEALIKQDLENIPEAQSNLAWIYFLRGENLQAIAQYELALKLFKKINGKRKIYFSSLSGLFYLLALFKTKDIKQYKKISEFVEICNSQNNDFMPAYLCMEALLLVEKNELNLAKLHLMQTMQKDDVISIICASHVMAHLFPEKLEIFKKKILSNFKKSKDLGYQWISMELASILKQIDSKDDQFPKHEKSIRKTTKITPIFVFEEKKEAWERSLKMLTDLATKPSLSSNSARLCWFVDFETNSRREMAFSPVEQKLGKNGKWTKGRPIALKRIMNGELESMTPQDHSIGATINHYHYGYYGGYSYEFDKAKTIQAMVEHPLLFLSNSENVPVELVKYVPEILVEQKDEKFELKFADKIDPSLEYQLIKDTPTHYKLVEISQAHREIAKTIGSHGLTVPKRAKKQLIETVSNLSSLVTIHSDVEGEIQNIPKVTADKRIYVHLLPIGEGLKLELFVRPFTTEGPYFKPGVGRENIISVIKGQKVQTKRKLTQEKNTETEVIKSCPTLSMIGSSVNEWVFEVPEDCLQVLVELEELRKKIVIEWPEGEKFRVSHQASFDKFAMKIKQENDWFEVSGKLKLDKSLMIDMQKLLDLVESSPTRFIPLGDRQYLALTQKFRDQLKTFNSFADKTKEGLKFHQLASMAVEDFTENIDQLKVDTAWKKNITRIQEAREIKPIVPSTLQTELRDYQIEGYNWISRLAHMGVGACLADDMGLGKTIQALAIMLDRAKNGPIFVVAPASVCANWEIEADRFAPSLNTMILGGNARSDMINNLKPFDLMICSYGLMQQELELLSKVKWNMIVLDEAQAIKNTNAKRSKAALKLQGDFKMITTGTPMENHLGELWNLFSFINPGLLGSLDRFNERYALPISKNIPEPKKQLKKLIQPFILRRKKSNVLDELPAKTEITLSVDMTKEELAFYEVLRQEAVKKMEGMEDNNDGSSHLKILAEIMRLRRACCHSKLIMPESTIESSKLNLFSTVVDELLENRHKALVFSQFVGHLELIKELVEKKGIKYQYLDGSTPLKERQKRVSAFQAGEGDLFLISLKAGGVGLNLTAANYVIHMDPWWNPAVEDQASDRAHRIGQKNPVTIYRLVTKDSIEEKIVNLHKKKRDLADSLLE